METGKVQGAFGLSKEATLQDVLDLGGEPIEGQPFRYRLRSVPKPHSGFESYTVNIGRGRVVAVDAFGKDILTSVYGDAVVNAFDRMQEALCRKYGECERFDFLRVGSIWDEPKDWTMALLKQERTLVAYWGIEHGSQLPVGLESISLHAQMLETETGFLILAYKFDNFEDYERDVEAFEDEAL